MRILIVTQYFPPEGSAAFYPASLAHELAERGHDVKVVTGYPNYPAGELFPDYKMKWRSEESYDKASVLRVPLYVDHSNSVVKRIINYISFGISSALTRKWTSSPDVIYVYATQMTPAIGPWIWRIFGGAPYILHVQDLWPDSILGSSLVSHKKLSKTIEIFLNPWLKAVYKRSSGVIAIAPTMVKTLISRGVPSENTHLIFNWGDKSIKARTDYSARDVKETTEFLYAGNLGDMQDLETLVKAAAMVKNSGIIVRIVGDGVAAERVKAVAEISGATNVIFEGSVPMNEVSRFYESADFALVTLKDLPNFRGTIPSKFQAAIAHGLPVITTVQGDLRNLVESLQVGFTAESENVEDLARILSVASSVTPEEYKFMVDKASEAHNTLFSLEAGVSEIEKIMKNSARAE